VGAVWVGVGHRGGPTPAERNRKNGLHARPHPGPLPQERGRRARARRVLGIEEGLRRWSGTARMDYTLALTPTLSPRRGGGARGLGGCWASRRAYAGGAEPQEWIARSPSPRPSPPGEGEARAVWAGVGHRGELTPAERNRKNGLHARPHPGPLPQERGWSLAKVMGVWFAFSGAVNQFSISHLI